MEIKCQLDATEVFIADLITCSTCFGHHYAHHQGLKGIIQRSLPVVFRAVAFKLLVWCGAEGYVSGLQDAGLYPPSICSFLFHDKSGNVNAPLFYVIQTIYVLFLNPSTSLFLQDHVLIHNVLPFGAI